MTLLLSYFGLLLLESIDEIIRKPEAVSDDFSKMHLESWVVGSEDVIRNTQKIMMASDRNTRKEALKNLVAAMRNDVGLPRVKGVELEGVFKEQSKDHLP